MDEPVKAASKQESYSNDSSKITKFLNKISYFDDWNIAMKKECEKFSKIKRFSEEDIMFEEGSNTSQYVHFIMEGQAKVIQMIRKQNKKDQANSDNCDYDDDVYFIEVLRFSEMSCFNIGEELHDRIVISSRPNTECLLIPSFWLLEINKKLWHRMRFFFERNIPSKEEAERRFFKRKHFSKHGKHLVEKIHEKSRKSLYNQVFNIPLSLRLHQRNVNTE